MAMSFLRKTYPDQLINYTGDDLPDALDLITAALTTPSPTDYPQHGMRVRRRHHRPWEDSDLEVLCRRAYQEDDLSFPDHHRGGLAEFWRKRRKLSLIHI